MKFYDDTKPLYLETDASRVGLGAALLQTQEGTTCQKEMVPANTILHPIAFDSKSLTGMVVAQSMSCCQATERIHH